MINRVEVNRQSCRAVGGELQNRPEFWEFLRFDTMPSMHDILVILIHSIVTVVRLMKPGGLRAVVAESALTRHQISKGKIFMRSPYH